MTSFRSLTFIGLIVCLFFCSIFADFTAQLLSTPSRHSKWAATVITNTQNEHTSPVDVSVQLQYNDGYTISSTKYGYAAAFDFNLSKTSNDPFISEISKKWENNSFVWDNIQFPYLNSSNEILLVSPIETVDVNATEVTGNVSVTVVDGNNTSNYNTTLLHNEFIPDWVANFTVDPVIHNETAEWLKLNFDIIANANVDALIIGAFGLVQHTHFFVHDQNSNICKLTTGNQNNSNVNDVAVALHPSLTYVVMIFFEKFVFQPGPATLDCVDAVGISISEKGPQSSLVTLKILKGSAFAPTMTIMHDSNTPNKPHKHPLFAFVAIGIGAAIIAIVIALVVVQKVCCQKKSHNSDAYDPLINN